MLPIHIKTFFFNITYWNERPDEPATFTELYDFSEEYGIEDLRPSNIAKLAEEFLTNEDKASKYWHLKRSGRWDQTSCDEVCWKDVYCQTFSSIYAESMQCKPHYEKIDF